MKKHILGFPRIGPDRELKWALESYWRGTCNQAELVDSCRQLRFNNWETQRKAGLSYVTTGDFSLYDHVLDITAMIGAVPERFEYSKGIVDETLYFSMARGEKGRDVLPMEMTKWFNTNYHFIVPEISSQTNPRLSCSKILEETGEAVQAGYSAKPVIVGPITYLSLCKGVNGFDCWEKLDSILDVYEEVISRLGKDCEWIQIDEPILCTDMAETARNYFPATYQRLNKVSGRARILLATYFDTLDDNLDLALDSGCPGLHLDLVRGRYLIEDLLDRIPKGMVLSAGLVEGRNIWKTDLSRSLVVLEKMNRHLGDGNVMVSSSCSLLHCPVDLERETEIDAEIKNWMAFAVQKCEEISILGDSMGGRDCSEIIEASHMALESRRSSGLVNDPKVQIRSGRVEEDMLHRNSRYPVRRKEQARLNLPELPTTTIGSFPQTPEIRRERSRYRKGEISEAEYNIFLKKIILQNIEKQLEIGLDVLVHGEPERNDMVEYFGQQLRGFSFTKNGWVQSYGSRCVKPPVIHGDVSRPVEMTTEWIIYAQFLTRKPLKGMLTGPVTMMCWSFVRDDIEPREICRQLALAIRDEVLDLEKKGIRIIQIDEAALSEGRPVKKRDRGEYLRWAVEAFRLVTSGVEDSTQIHTHMCYSEFNDMIEAIADMDADVISIESSRSKMELLDAFRDFEYPNEIGPGVYDIHSPRVPSREELVGLLAKAAEYIPKDRLWVNPDCGLKTRDWKEVIPALENMVAAARSLRTREKGLD